MADSARTPGNAQHLDAAGSRSVVYCHACEHEWYQDEHGLKCPNCDSEATEIITPDNDPREINEAPEYPHYPNFRDSPLPWASSGASGLFPLPRNGGHAPGEVPEEQDLMDEHDHRPPQPSIERHVRRYPGGPVVITSTFRTTAPSRAMRGGSPSDPPQDIFRDFQDMVATMMGPRIRMGEPGRSGPETLFGGQGDGQNQTQGATPIFRTQRYTFVSPGLRPRDANAPQSAEDHVDPFQRLLEDIFNPQPPAGGADDEGGIPMGLHGLLASIFNPVNAVHGDVVYSQEALDRIISNLMEQHPTSNAPGPAPEAAIAALPKKLLDEEMLGPELRGECSVCMDDVFVGIEVVQLPCKHWFHEACASEWLREHNTCPICRKSITDESSSGNTPTNPTPNPPASDPEPAHPASYPDPPSPTGEYIEQLMQLQQQGSDRERRNRRLEAERAAAPSPLRDTIASNAYRSRYEARERSPSPSSGYRMPGGFVSSSSSSTALPTTFRRRDSDMSNSQRESRRLWESRRPNLESPRGSQRRNSGSTSSHSTQGSANERRERNNGGSSSGGAFGWIRDHLPGGRRHD